MRTTPSFSGTETPHRRQAAASTMRLPRAPRPPDEGLILRQRPCGSLEGQPCELVKRLSTGAPARVSRPSVAALDVLPGDVAVDLGFLRQAEDALAEDVAHDLGGAALDGVGPAAQEAPDGRGGVLVGGGPGHAGAAEEVDGQVLQAPVELGLEELGDGALGAGLLAGL